MSDPLTGLLTILFAVALFIGGYALYKACRKANRTDWGVGWMNLLDGLNRLFCLRYHRLNPTVLRIPSEGPVILAANHISGLDPLLLIASARRPLRFLIAREEYERFGLTWLFKAVGCIPVDRTGRPERAMRAAIRALSQGEVVAIFPHGKIHLDTDPPRRLKGGVTRLAAIAECPVTPARITGVAHQGSVFAAVVSRGNARVEAFHPMTIEEDKKDEFLATLAEIIEGRLIP